MNRKNHTQKKLTYKALPNKFYGNRNTSSVDRQIYFIEFIQLIVKKIFPKPFLSQAINTLYNKNGTILCLKRGTTEPDAFYKSLLQMYKLNKIIFFCVRTDGMHSIKRVNEFKKQ